MNVFGIKDSFERLNEHIICNCSVLKVNFITNCVPILIEGIFLHVCFEQTQSSNTNTHYIQSLIDFIFFYQLAS